MESEQSYVLYQLYAMLFEIDVSKEGVGGAKNFFEAKVTLFFVDGVFVGRLFLGRCCERGREVSSRNSRGARTKTSC